jgi:sugar phosphate isomerase/epimerase
MSNPYRLTCGVMTSSSTCRLRHLFTEVAAIDGVTRFDAMILRETDVRRMDSRRKFRLDKETSRNAPHGAVEDIADIVSREANRDKIVAWLEEQCTQAERNLNKQKIVLSALATYFPGVTSMVPERRLKAVNALASTVRIALALKRNGRMPQAIVEMVCGNLLDPCTCTMCEGQTIFAYKRADKIRLLCQSLREVVEAVQHDEKDPFALALELEPGETYVFRDIKTMRLIDNALSSPKCALLKPYVGYNFDIAHMRIARISADKLKPYLSRIVHAHIADHPGLHTRDQIVGIWSPVERRHSGYYDYVRLLQERGEEYQRGLQERGGQRTGDERDLPFSGVIALELEGCGRVNWIHRSLTAMKHLTHAASNYDQEGNPIAQ